MRYSCILLENGKFPYDATFKVYIEKLLPTIKDRTSPVTKNISLNTKGNLNQAFKIKPKITSVNFIECDNMTFFRDKLFGDIDMKKTEGITDKFDPKTSVKQIVFSSVSGPGVISTLMDVTPGGTVPINGTVPMSALDHDHKISKELKGTDVTYTLFDKVKLSQGHEMVCEFLEDDFEKGKITFINDIIKR